jgi:hypothetical protein
MADPRVGIGKDAKDGVTGPGHSVLAVND